MGENLAEDFMTKLNKIEVPMDIIDKGTYK